MTRSRKQPARRKKSTSQASLTGIVLKGVIAAALVGGVVYGIAWLGGRAGRQVADRDRYAVPVADIVCDAPPGKDRATFLTEVRYLAQLPESVQAVDPELPGRLVAAFGRHPWVAEVHGVKVEPDATVRVDLRFRVPVLAVHVIGDSELRAVDRWGVLLPPCPGLSVTELANAVLPPKRPAGEVWNDPTVTRAAELAAEFQPRRIEKTARDWRLTLPTGKVLVVGW